MNRPLIDRTNKRCGKQGHRSRGAAEAHLRGLMKAQEFKPDWKPRVQMVVYYCIAKTCSEAPWHVGHDRHARAG
jgi:hypothetical protein